MEYREALRILGLGPAMAANKENSDKRKEAFDTIDELIYRIEGLEK